MDMTHFDFAEAAELTGLRGGPRFHLGWEWVGEICTVGGGSKKDRGIRRPRLQVERSRLNAARLGPTNAPSVSIPHTATSLKANWRIGVG